MLSSDLLDREAVARRLRITVKSFDKLRERSASGAGPTFPEPVMVRARTPLWHINAVDKFNVEHPRRHRRTNKVAAA